MWSEAYAGESAMPRRPPSPAGATPGTWPSSVFLPVFSSTRVIVPSSREDTSRPPSGSGARPQGDLRFSVTVRSTFTEPLAGAAVSVARGADDAPVPVPPLDDGLRPPIGAPPPPPEEQPAVTTSAAAANTAFTTRRCTIRGPFDAAVLLFIHRASPRGSRTRTPGPSGAGRPDRKSVE